jgi:hypothetical protein
MSEFLSDGQVQTLVLSVHKLIENNSALLSDCRWAMGKVLEANDGDHIITPDSDAQRAQAWLDAHKEQAQ